MPSDSKAIPVCPSAAGGNDGLMLGSWKNGTPSGFRYRTDPTRDDATVSAEWSELLENWTSEGLLVIEEGREDDLSRWKVTLPGGFPTAFVRLYVTAED